MILPAKPSKGGDQSMNMQNNTLQVWQCDMSGDDSRKKVDQSYMPDQTKQ